MAQGDQDYRFKNDAGTWAQVGANFGLDWVSKQMHDELLAQHVALSEKCGRMDTLAGLLADEVEEKAERITQLEVKLAELQKRQEDLLAERDELRRSIQEVTGIHYEQAHRAAAAINTAADQVDQAWRMVAQYISSYDPSGKRRTLTDMVHRLCELVDQKQAEVKSLTHVLKSMQSALEGVEL